VIKKMTTTRMNKKRKSSKLAWFLIAFAFIFAFVAKFSRDNDHEALVLASENIQKRNTRFNAEEERTEHGLTIESKSWSSESSESSSSASEGGGRCGAISNAEMNAEYSGDVVKWGESNEKESIERCCEDCENTKGCNAYVFCNERENGCNGRKFGECWLKRQSPNGAMRTKMSSGSDVQWASGSLYSHSEFEEAMLVTKKTEERRRVQREKKGNVKAFFDVRVGDYGKVSRIEFILYQEDCPNFVNAFRRLLATKGINGDGYKGSSFYRIIDKFIDQTGPVSGRGVERFDDDYYGLHSLKHDRFGLLSAANSGPNTNTGHFSIVVAPSPHLDTHYTIFGEVVSGFDTVWEINKLDKARNNKLKEKATIVDCGEL
jgi:peptidyl-prolyl isomerase D